MLRTPSSYTSSNACLLVSILLFPVFIFAEPLVVHEWGTITTRHFADGKPQGRLNLIEASELLPEFVHKFEPSATSLRPGQLVSKTLRYEPSAEGPPVRISQGRQDVTMRLETPVLYFHPRKGQEFLRTFDVRVRFRSGIITEFYPDGNSSVPSEWNGEKLDLLVTGTLLWDKLMLTAPTKLKHTDNEVWLAPREVSAAGIESRAGEREKYLFYRGVASLPALFETRHDNALVSVRDSGKRYEWAPNGAVVSKLWLVEITPQGTAAFRERNHVELQRRSSSQELFSVARFSQADFSRDNLSRLRESMRQALQAQGLFEDEARAMLKTWQHQYFERPGMRIFYTVPQEWLSYHLSLEISYPTTLTRVLIGRIDLLSPEEASLAVSESEMADRRQHSSGNCSPGQVKINNATYKVLCDGRLVPLSD